MGQVPGPLHIQFPLATKPRPLEDTCNSSENILLSTSERNSSEEELACMDRPVPEKRKWSQMNQWNRNSDVSSSSDEEVKDLFTKTAASPLQFSTSPPKHLYKLSPKRIDSKTHFMANVISPSSGDSCSPRKRHRHSHHDTTLQSGRRIDFEKMQQVRLKSIIFLIHTCMFGCHFHIFLLQMCLFIHEYILTCTL